MAPSTMPARPCVMPTHLPALSPMKAAGGGRRRTGLGCWGWRSAEAGRPDRWRGAGRRTAHPARGTARAGRDRPPTRQDESRRGRAKNHPSRASVCSLESPVNGPGFNRGTELPDLRYEDQHRTPRQNGVVPIAFTAYRTAPRSRLTGAASGPDEPDATSPSPLWVERRGRVSVRLVLGDRHRRGRWLMWPSTRPVRPSSHRV
jgi:hypothetical protein